MDAACTNDENNDNAIRMVALMMILMMILMMMTKPYDYDDDTDKD